LKEKLLKSLNTSDLKDEEWETHVHLVASLGASQIGNRGHLSLGALLLHIRAGHSRFYARALALLKAQVQSKAKKGRWVGVTPERASELAAIALERHFNPLCPVCHGVGRIGELGQVIVLCSKSHGGCGGTGKRDDRWRGWMERVKDVLAMLERYEGYASGGTKRQARGALQH
jgi:hypothetical protein